MKKNILIILFACPLLVIGQEEFSIDMQNTERTNHSNTGGLIYYDLNFYPDYPEFNNDGGGLSVYSSEDGWGAIFDTNNMRWLRPEFRGLDVNGGVKLNPGLSNENSLQVVSNNSSQINLLLYVQNSAQWNLFAHNDGRLLFRRTDNNADGGIKFALKGDHVGIGTSAPSSLLDAVSANNNKTRLNYADTPSVSFIPNNGNSHFHISHTLDNRLTISQGSNVANNKLLTIVNSGAVGIGTTSPDAKLAVNGKIHAKEVKVDLTGWPDYVFANNHDLPTLKEVEKHIKEKGHLIKIPSAKEVEENGVELGEMNKLLLEKIEELTLYTLEQEKKLMQMKNLELELELQGEAIKELKAEIEKLKK